jgi:hypothetical protein
MLTKTWLDNAGNLVDEECVIEALDAASDFERGVERLSDNGKAALSRLRQAAGEDVSKKRKRRQINLKPYEFGTLIQCLFDRFRHHDHSGAKTCSGAPQTCNQMLLRVWWLIPSPSPRVNVNLDQNLRTRSHPCLPKRKMLP